MAAAARPRPRCTIVWDFDDTLVPWYRLKRGKDLANAALPEPARGARKALYARLFALQRALQAGRLAGALEPAWEAAHQLSELPEAARRAVERAHWGSGVLGAPGFRGAPPDLGLDLATLAAEPLLAWRALDVEVILIPPCIFHH
jgi:hypothetical protein